MLGSAHAHRRLPLCVVAAALAALSVGTASSTADAASRVAWEVETIAQPTSFGATDTEDAYAVVVTNVGSAPSSGPVTLRDRLPAGVVSAGEPRTGGEWNCTEETAGEIACVTENAIPAVTPAHAVLIPVALASGAAGSVENEVQVSGGVAECGQTGAPACPSATATTTTALEQAPTAFGLLGFAGGLFDGFGQPFTEAGGHPDALTTAFTFASARTITQQGQFSTAPVENVKQIVIDLPPGLVGDIHALPTCSLTDMTNLELDPNACPPPTHVGILTLGVRGAKVRTNLALINVTPERGHVAEFAVYEPLFARDEVLYANVGPAPRHAVEIVSAPQDRYAVVETTHVASVFFGKPAAATGDGLPEVATLTAASDCTARNPQVEIHVDSWQHAGRVLPDGAPDLSDANWQSAVSPMPAVGGCAALQFQPTLSLAPEPEHTGPDEPSGYGATLTVPQNEDPAGLATPPLKTTTVTLPAGVAISPAAANGLVGCSEGAEGIGLAAPAESNLPGHCPGASRVGTAKVVTSLLKEPLEGGVFVAQPACSPCSEAQAEKGEVFALYLELGSGTSGVYIKLKGDVEVGGSGHNNDLAPGQVRTRFAETPQYPFNELKLTFNGGPRAPLSNPQACGVYSSTAQLEPWSHAPAPGESAGTPNASLQPSFTIAGDCAGGFAPTLQAGTVDPRAGRYSPFTLTLSRRDGEQDLGGLETRLPAGLLGKIAGIALCPQAQADAGSCQATSRIGTATASAGAGPQPFWQSGPVYLTGPYRGAPFGLSVVVPAVAGPYDLGTIVVRAGIYIDPRTAQVTVASDPLPQSIDGVPLRVQTINVTVGESAAFSFNATSCAAQAVSAAVTGVQGAEANLANRYAPAGCAALPFAPKFSVSTRHDGEIRNHGASLEVKLAFAHAGPQGAAAGEADTHYVKVTLPKALPARLATLQKACTEAQFARNPAGCPAASFVGTALARTPLLNAPLTGPAILVSHGGEAFPDLDIVLQGEGVEIVLTGNTAIKHGVTSSTFALVPDAPVSSFELTLPEGPHSALAAVGNLCRQSLAMPTTFGAQNGATRSRDTQIEVEGCANALAVKFKRVSGRTVTLGVWVPAGGHLSATGAGLTGASKVSHGREELRLTLHDRRRGKFTRKVRLSFTPSSGKERRKLVKSVSVRV
jgi:hypothetical protein